jgi:integrase/recombinase XerC
VPGVRSEVLKDMRGPGVPAVRRLLKAAAGKENEPKAARDVAILRLLFDLALRRAELVGLDVGGR